MGGKESSSQSENKMNIICPKCSLTPIISISLNSEGILSCEYRCPYMHFGIIPFEDFEKDKWNKPGKFCDRCSKSNKEEKEDKKSNTKIKEELLYCGTCKQYICKKCRPEHDIEKESHKTLVPKSQMNYICLEHGKLFIGFCFTCLISICQDCKKHEKHCKKKFVEFYPDEDFIEGYNYHIKDYDNYLNFIFKSSWMNRNQFNRFKQRSQLLYDLSLYLFSNFEEKKKKKQLNGETIINLLNVVCFNFRANYFLGKEEFTNYCKTHLILYHKPLSDICNFSKTKADYNLSKLELEEFSPLTDNGNPSEFKYSPIGDFIIFHINSSIHLLNIMKQKNRFTIKLDNIISSINIINTSILCVCSKKIYLYHLSEKAPFYSEYNKSKDLDIFSDPVVEVFGNLEKILLIRTTKELLLVIEDKDNEGKYKIVERIWLEDINTKVEETGTYNYHLFNYGYVTKTITITKSKLTKIKAIFNEYIVLIENGIITTRKLNNLNIIQTLKEYKDIDCVVFNGNVLIYNETNIFFYSIPNLDRVSQIKVEYTIFSLNLVNKKTLIIVEDKFLEQYETNTWKRLSRDYNLLDNSIITIGAGKKLFLFNKERKMFYQLVMRKNKKKK